MKKLTHRRKPSGLVILGLLLAAGCSTRDNSYTDASAASYYMYVLNSGDSTITGYQVNNATGALTQITGSPFSVRASATSFTATPSGKYIYTTHGGGTAGVAAYSVASDSGKITEVNGSYSLMGSAPTAIQHGVVGSELYLGHSSTTYVSGYDIDSTTGKLTFEEAYSTGTGASQIQFNANGDTSFVSNSTSGKIYVYAVNTITLKLIPFAGSPYTSGSGVSSLASRGGRNYTYLYAANSSANTLSVFSFNDSDGSLTHITGSPVSVGTTPTGISTDSNGDLLFVPNKGSNTVQVFQIDSDSGALTETTGSPFSTGSQPSFAKTSPTGGFLYVLNSAANTISAYSYHSTTGALTEIAGSPFSTGSTPASIAFVRGTQ